MRIFFWRLLAFLQYSAFWLCFELLWVDISAVDEAAILTSEYIGVVRYINCNLLRQVALLFSIHYLLVTTIYRLSSSPFFRPYLRLFRRWILYLLGVCYQCYHTRKYIIIIKYIILYCYHIYIIYHYIIIICINIIYHYYMRNSGMWWNVFEKVTNWQQLGGVRGIRLAASILLHLRYRKNIYPGN